MRRLARVIASALARSTAFRAGRMTDCLELVGDQFQQGRERRFINAQYDARKA
jgi:hypothetical protein